MDEPQLFDTDEEGARRSVLFAISVVTGFISLVAATSAYVAGARLAVPIALLALALVTLVFGALVWAGRFGALVESDEFLWHLSK